MKRAMTVLLVFLLLSGCKAPAGESPAPTAVPTPAPAAEAAPTPAATPAPTPAVEAVSIPEPTPASDLGDLTQEEVERINAAFSGFEERGEGIVQATAVSGFFTSHYSDPRELNFLEFLWYYPGNGGLEEKDEAEFAALAALPEFPWTAEAGMGAFVNTFPRPVHRILRSSVDETLKKYAGITTADLKDTDGVLYVPEYGAYYTFTSDFGPGSFTCEGGWVEGDTAILWSDRRDVYGSRDVLTLKKEGESWYIRSFLRKAVDREESLTAYLQGLTGEEIRNVSSSWGFGKLPDGDAAAELVRKAAQNSVESWTYNDDDWEERTVWDMDLTLVDGRRCSLGAGVKKNIVKVTLGEKAAYYRSPELYWILRTEYDSEVVNGKGTIDRKALERYQEAVDKYLAQQAFAPEIRMELTGFALVQENPALNAQVWQISADMTTDPPELAPRMVGNGYVDSKLRMYGIGSDWYNLLVTAEGEALGFQGWNWLEAGGLDQYATVEELKEAMNGR